MSERCTSAASVAHGGLRRAGKRVAATLDAVTRSYRTLVLRGDGLAGDQEELDRLSSPAAGATVAGFHTYGEIARPSGSHDQTPVVLAVG